MEETVDEALLLEALSDKVLHQLPPAVWKELFLGAGRDSIHFEHRHLTLVHADADVPTGTAGWEPFWRELRALTGRYRGHLDPYAEATALAFFEDPGAAVRMGMALQRAATGLGLRVGMVSGRCTLAFFRAQDRLWCTPLGLQPQRAARVAATAAIGGIVISPETYAPAAPGQEPPTADFADSEADLSALGSRAFA
jgi:class 3 adenylate cyclase